jgi:catechol 2,3-dioxygenase-like lactoylglutathione lyase family enzyme
MNNELKLGKFDQIGIVVRDIEKAAELYKDLFEFRGNGNIVEQSATVTCRGEEGEYKMKKIMDFFGEKQLEIVEILESTGPNLYTEFLEEGRQGLHHLGIYVKDAEKFITTFNKLYNIEAVQVGHVGKLTFTYLDTREFIGYYVELIEF